MPNRFDCFIALHAAYYAVGDHVDVAMLENDDFIVLDDTMLDELVKPLPDDPKQETLIEITGNTHEAISPFWVFQHSLMSEHEMSGIECEIEAVGTADVFENHHGEILEILNNHRAAIQQINEKRVARKLLEAPIKTDSFTVITAWTYSAHYCPHTQEHDSDWDLLGRVDCNNLMFKPATGVNAVAETVAKYRDALEKTKGHLRHHDHEFYTEVLGYADSGEVIDEIEEGDVYQILADEFAMSRIQVKNQLFQTVYGITKPETETVLEHYRKSLIKQGFKPKDGEVPN